MDLISKIKFMGKFVVEHLRQGVKIGEYELVESFNFFNTVVTEGKNKVLDIAFRNQTQIAQWYIGLIDNAGFTALNVNDTMTNHTGWAELTAYTEANRQNWTTTAATGGQITNAVAATFTMNATNTVKGIFVASGNT